VAKSAQSKGDPTDPNAGDHRVRVAREKRERMRKRLLDATMEVCANTPGPSPIVVDDILRAANISRGTFYNYFTSVEEAVSAVGRDRAEEFSELILHIRGGIASPLQHVAVAHHLFLSRAAIEPVWGSYFLRWNYLVAPPKGGYMKNALLLGRESGDFQYDSVSNALDFTMGAVIGAVRRLVRDKRPSIKGICEVQRMILLGLGVSPKRAQETVDYAVSYVRENGSQISWWRELSATKVEKTEAGTGGKTPQARRR
jgi:AcrR family transcriptional regulator